MNYFVSGVAKLSLAHNSVLWVLNLKTNKFSNIFFYIKYYFRNYNIFKSFDLKIILAKFKECQFATKTVIILKI